MLGAVGIAIIVAYYWFKQHQGGGGTSGCSGSSGNCIYNMCTSGAYRFCWRGIRNSAGQIGQVCGGNTGLPNPSLTEGCNYVRSVFLKCANQPKSAQCPWEYTGGGVV